MINREQLKLEIDTIDDAYIEILHRIILALKQPSLTPTPLANLNPVNSLKSSVTDEGDLIAPIDKANTSESLLSRLKQIKISAPPDFSENLDAYLNGEKNV